MTVALVTGATGQDGSYLVDRLLAEGVRVHGLVRPGDEVRADGWTPHAVDLADRAGLRALVLRLAPDELYNLGGISSVARSWAEPELTVELSGLAPVTLLDAALAVQETAGRPVRVVQASSAEIFGHPDRVPQDESTPVAPRNPYGVAKALAHHAAAVYRGRGLHVTSCVLFNHESPRRPTTFVTRKITRGAARIALGLDDTLVLGNLEARRDWGWAPDYVDAMVRAARHDHAVDWVVATGRAHSVAEFVAAAFAAAGLDDWERHVRVDPALLRTGDAPELVGDPGRAERELGWRRTHDLTGLVAAMVAHDLAHPEG
ncbi:GDP-mannose 4,6-dehydratase [Cellulomonas triticagri]|uniref:GDP-mannose 4,6-dehydratase n=1 Tax=Cellulomonas triticagri TaxID=2483352 RepID=A0A3M2JGX1_9CELL|nr:GDP-mannose 4,6-dehydratase [Cellulomonas triticagri]RMI13287.1 GDP-mannose 4,6-dehydratase [Cellulomonas triticagri]